MIQTYNKVKKVFPSEGVTAIVVVEADDVRSGPVAAGIADLRAEVKGSDAFLPGTEVIYSEDGTVAQINVPTPGNGTDAPSVERPERAPRRDHPGDRRQASRGPRSTSAATRPAPRTSPAS